MKILVLVLAAFLAGCSRSDRWSIAAVRDESDAEFRRLRVEIGTRGAMPWPLRLSLSAVDATGRRIEATLPRWDVRQTGPNVVALTFAERITEHTKPVTLDLKIAASGHAKLHAHHFLAAAPAAATRGAP